MIPNPNNPNPFYNLGQQPGGLTIGGPGFPPTNDFPSMPSTAGGVTSNSPLAGAIPSGAGAEGSTPSVGHPGTAAASPVPFTPAAPAPNATISGGSGISNLLARVGGGFMGGYKPANPAPGGTSPSPGGTIAGSPGVASPLAPAPAPGGFSGGRGGLFQSLMARYNRPQY